MKRVVLVLAALLCSSCSVADVYLEADRLTYEAIGREYLLYVRDDTRLTLRQKERRMFTVETWYKRIQATKGK